MLTRRTFAQVATDDMQAFYETFSGRENCHGEFIPDLKNSEGVKSAGKARTLKVAATREDYEKHLKGEKGLGINPLKKDNTVAFFVLDVDDYTLDKVSIELKLEKFGLKHVTFLSKSGGLHIYFFMKERSPADKLKKIASELKFLLGLPQSTEFFPKQTNLLEDDLGNWINLPYFGDSRKAIIVKKNTLVEVDLRHALDLISAKRTTLEEIQACFSDIPMCDAPPCLQKLFLADAQGSLEHCRNKFLFNAGIYYKKKDSAKFKALVSSLNSSLCNPINSKELEKTVIQSLSKKDYSYTCEDSFMNESCCEELCVTRDFGKLDASSTNLCFGQLTRINYDPPIYVWDVNSKEFVYDSEKDLCSQSVFRDLCIRNLNLVPTPFKQKEWLNLLNRSLKDIHVEEVAEEEKLSRAFVFKSALKSFFTSKLFASVPEQFVAGMPYFSEELCKVYFKLEVFTKYLNSEVALERYSTLDVRKNLKSLEVVSEKIYISSKRAAYRAWAIDVRKLYDKSDEFDAFYNQIKENRAQSIDLYDNTSPEVNFYEEDF